MDQFADILANELKPGEEILWQDKPDPKLFLKKGWKLPLILIGLSIGMIWIDYEHTGIIWSGRNFIWMALILIALQGLFRAYYRIKKQTYVLTNAHAMIISGSTINSYSKDSAANYRKTVNADGSGNIIFTGAGIKGSFLWLRDVNSVSAALDKLKEHP